MRIHHGPGKTKHGPGVSIELTADETCLAIDAYLVSHGVVVRGPRTITFDGKSAEVYVDPSGSVSHEDGCVSWHGSGGYYDEAWEGL